MLAFTVATMLKKTLMHCSKSDLVPARKPSPCERADGAAWFSYEKNWSTSPFLVWHAMYSLEKMYSLETMYSLEKMYSLETMNSLEFGY